MPRSSHTGITSTIRTTTWLRLYVEDGLAAAGIASNDLDIYPSGIKAKAPAWSDLVCYNAYIQIEYLVYDRELHKICRATERSK